MRKIVLVSMLVSLFSVAALADIPKPSPARQRSAIDSTLRIHLQRDAKEARLIIPKSQIQQLRAQLEELDGGDATAGVAGLTASKLQTILGGLFLSLAIVFGGIWLARSGKLTARSSAAAVIITGFCAAATFVYSNVGPPPEARSITGKMFSQAVHLYGFGSGSVKLETSTDTDAIELIVPNPFDAPKTGEE